MKLVKIYGPKIMGRSATNKEFRCNLLKYLRMVIATAIVSEITKKIWLIEEVSTSAKVALIRNKVIKLMNFRIQIRKVSTILWTGYHRNWVRAIEKDEVFPCEAEYEPAFSAETVHKCSSNTAKCKLDTTNGNLNEWNIFQTAQKRTLGKEIISNLIMMNPKIVDMDSNQSNSMLNCD